MTNQKSNSELLELLPPELQRAQKAIELAEVQEIAKKLSKYNLEIYMPHRHNELDGSFELLSNNEIQVENDLQVSFVPRQEFEKLNTLQVGWTWKGDELTGSMSCDFGCHLETHPVTGAIHHIKNHK
jgi:hypothetical protein